MSQYNRAALHALSLWRRARALLMVYNHLPISLHPHTYVSVFLYQHVPWSLFPLLPTHFSHTLSEWAWQGGKRLALLQCQLKR